MQQPTATAKPAASAPAEPQAAYVHVPFCARRCGYCNFTLVAGRGDLIEPYLSAIEWELARLGRPRRVQTLFLGGGTPTILSADQLRRLMDLVLHWHPLAIGGEFSVEANPADLDAEKVAVFAAAGVNRVSLGAQSFDASKLFTLERQHSVDDIVRTVDLVREEVASVSLDLIFGVPGETRAIWERDLERCLRLPVDHVSTYGLTFEQGTTYWNRRRRGRLQPLPEETEAALYETAIDRLAAADFEHYEVSNFAQAGHRCRHNETYWLGKAYFGVGPGAARYVDGRREMNHRSTTTYLRRVAAGQSPVAECEQLSPEDRGREALVFGLRRLEGVDRAEFAGRTGFRLDHLAGPALLQFIQQGLLEDDGHRLRLTRRGLLVSDSLWPAFLRA